MTHRAGQIVDAIASRVQARVLHKGIKTFTHRRQSLSEEQDELPAVSVDFGTDERADTVVIGKIGSLLQVQITAMSVDVHEDDLKSQLLDMRRDAHIAVMDDAKLGLDFVVDTLYGGAEAPEISFEGEELVGALTSSWLVYYVMNMTDPAG